MNIVKSVNIPLAFHCKLSSSLCLGYEEEKVMSHISYVNIVGSMYAMKWLGLNISHMDGVVIGHMENLGKEHLEVEKWVL